MDRFALALSATAMLPAIYGASLPNIAQTAQQPDSAVIARAHVFAGLAGLALAAAVATVSTPAGVLIAAENAILWAAYGFARTSSAD